LGFGSSGCPINNSGSGGRRLYGDRGSLSETKTDGSFFQRNRLNQK